MSASVAPAADLTEEDALGRVSIDSAPARRLAAIARLQPVVWDGEIDRRVRAEARLAFARLVAAQAQAAALDTAVPLVRDLAAALARGEDAGDAAGFDRIQTDRALADLQASAADIAEARARAQADLASFFKEAVDPRTLRVARAPAGPRGTVPGGEALVERALARAHEAPVPAATGGSARPATTVPDRDAATTARHAEIRVRVPVLGAIVTERRAAVDAFHRAAVGAAEDFERIAQVSYENGIRSALELLSAHRALAEARVRAAEAGLALRRAEIELEELTGEPLP